MIFKAARLVWRAFNRFLDHSGPDRAAAVAYYTLLSLLPLLIFMISLGVAVMGSFDRAWNGTLYLFGGEALALAERTRPDLVVCSELELCARLREGEPGRTWNRNVPVIVLGPVSGLVPAGCDAVMLATVRAGCRSPATRTYSRVATRRSTLTCPSTALADTTSPAAWSPGPASAGTVTVNGTTR